MDAAIHVVSQAIWRATARLRTRHHQQGVELEEQEVDTKVASAVDTLVTAQQLAISAADRITSPATVKLKP